MKEIMIYNTLGSNIIDVVSIVVTAAGLGLTVWSLWTLIRYQHSEQEDKIIKMLMDVEEKIHFAKEKDKDSYYERYVNLLDYFIYKCLNKKIDEDMYKYIIDNLVHQIENDERYTKFISEKNTTYLYYYINFDRININKELYKKMKRSIKK